MEREVEYLSKRYTRTRVQIVDRPRTRVVSHVNDLTRVTIQIHMSLRIKEIV